MQRVDATDHHARTNQRLPNRSVFLFKVNIFGGHRLRHSSCCGRLVAKQRLAFSFTSLLSISLRGMVRGKGFGHRAQDLVIRRTLRFLLVVSFNIAQLSGTCLPPLKTNCFTRVSLLKVVRSRNLRPSKTEKSREDGILRWIKAGNGRWEAQSHIILDFKSIKSDSSDVGLG